MKTTDRGAGLSTHYHSLWQSVSELMRLKSQKAQQVLASIKSFEQWVQEFSFCPEPQEIPALYQETQTFFEKNMRKLRIVGSFND